MDREPRLSERPGTNRLADFPYRSDKMDRKPQLPARLSIGRMAVEKSPHTGVGLMPETPTPSVRTLNKCAVPTLRDQSI